ncbi:hypothetical protein Y032_0014g2238 [Ancylostoma ceylanicum]|uniref:Uncharacterized protein n=1 Tax=Ancylostoma ceylanicum TaxID=53326 RepID=A0A016V952_9BILA|nr:hypothetical protein Y032_0014g2238 [Ancylostoma ceylanicum]
MVQTRNPSIFLRRTICLRYLTRGGVTIAWNIDTRVHCSQLLPAIVFPGMHENHMIFTVQCMGFAWIQP